MTDQHEDKLPPGCGCLMAVAVAGLLWGAIGYGAWWAFFK